MENDIVLFRYADALLMKSEAKVGTEQTEMKNSMKFVAVSTLLPALPL